MNCITCHRISLHRCFPVLTILSLIIHISTLLSVHSLLQLAGLIAKSLTSIKPAAKTKDCKQKPWATYTAVCPNLCGRYFITTKEEGLFYTGSKFQRLSLCLAGCQRQNLGKEEEADTLKKSCTAKKHHSNLYLHKPPFPMKFPIIYSTMNPYTLFQW